MIGNHTSSAVTFDRYEFVQNVPSVAIPCLLILGLAIPVGVFGNGIILLAVSKIKELDTSESIFVTNLAISDMFVPLIADPISIIAKLEGELFFEEIPHFCRIVGCLCTISCIVSLGTIACMSFNRCIHICFNHHYQRIFTKRTCVIMCISLYVLGTFLVLLNAIGIGDHEFDRKSLQCIWDRMASYPYTVVFSVALVWIPIVVVGISYATIFITVYKSQRRIHNRHSLEAPNNAVKGKFQRSVRLAKTLFIIYAAFSVCWIPYALLVVIDKDDTFSYVIHLYITMWAHLHPSVNWLVYYLTNSKFSEAFENILGIQRCLKSCRQTFRSRDRDNATESNQIEM